MSENNNRRKQAIINADRVIINADEVIVIESNDKRRHRRDGGNVGAAGMAGGAPELEHNEENVAGAQENQNQTRRRNPWW
ncbi:hypothetical protein ACNQFZ_01130 [Schinkia sp. CFF1]